MSDLFGNHIVGFLTRRLISRDSVVRIIVRRNMTDAVDRYIHTCNTTKQTKTFVPYIKCDNSIQIHDKHYSQCFLMATEYSCVFTENLHLTCSNLKI